ENPLQVVCRHVSLPWSYEDWSEVEEDEQQTRLMSFLEADGNRGFDLSRAPLMRVFLVKLGEQQHQLMWSYHHLLLDGWSVGLVLNEVFAFYDAFHLDRDLSLPAPRPYKDFVAWVGKQDLSQAESFWRERLKGISAPTSPAAGRTSEAGHDDGNA